jgi:hypothetical protein
MINQILKGIALNPSLYINLATLITVIIYTIVTYRLLSSQVKQGFESKFFQLLRFHHDIVAAIELSFGSNTVRGRANFQRIFFKFLDVYNAEYGKNPAADHLTTLQLAYVANFKPYQVQLGHYFRNLYHIVKFVDRSTESDKVFYMHLVRAQLSTYEHLLLFYNGLGPYGYKKFRPLIETYSLLENMPTDDLVSTVQKFRFDDKALYDPKAFGDTKQYSTPPNLFKKEKVKRIETSRGKAE